MGAEVKASESPPLSDVWGEGVKASESPPLCDVWGGGVKASESPLCASTKQTSNINKGRGPGAGTGGMRRPPAQQRLSPRQVPSRPGMKAYHS